MTPTECAEAVVRALDEYAAMSRFLSDRPAELLPYRAKLVAALVSPVPQDDNPTGGGNL